MAGYSPSEGSAAAARRGSAGIAFASTMLVLFVIMAAILVGVMSANGSRSGNGLAATGNTALAQSSSRMGSATAFNTAEAGVASALQWLSSRSSPPANTTAFAPSLWGGT